MNREDKKQLVEEYKTFLADATLVVLSQPNGMTVADSEELRVKARELGVNHKVARNSQAKIAFNESSFTFLADSVKGSISITWSDDPIAAAKIIAEFEKSSKKIKIVAGSLDGKELSVEEIRSLAALPSLDVLRAKIIGLLQAPAGKVAGTLYSGVSYLPKTILAYAKK